MKVCILTERMRVGFGVDLVVDEQANRLVKLGFDVVVFVIHADIIQPPRAYKLVVISRLMPLGDFASESFIKKVLSDGHLHNTDLWILHTPPFYDWTPHLDGPVILVEYGAPNGYFFSPDVGRHIDAMAKRRLTETYTGLLECDAIMSISKSIHDWLPTTVQVSSTVIHLGCDHYAYVAPEDARQHRAALGIGQDECLILWVGRMQLQNDEQPYKGFQELLGLIPLVQRQVQNVKFVLAGRVSERDKHMLSDLNVIVLANVPSEDMGKIYAAADVLINLSKWEGFNLALLEAQFQGTPVIAYDLGPHPEIVIDNRTGLLAKTPADFFEAVLRISTDTVLRKRLAAQASIFARDFTWDKSVGELVQLIEACASERLPGTDIKALRGTALAHIRAAERKKGRLTARDILKRENLNFVRTAYTAMYGKMPDEAAEAAWLGRLRRGMSKREIMLDMRDSAKSLGINKKIPGLRANLLGVRAKKLVTQMVTPRRRAGTSVWRELQNEIFVQHAFRVLLGREAERTAVDGYAALLREGHSRESVLRTIRFSEEGKNRPLNDPGLRKILRSDGFAHQHVRAGKIWPELVGHLWNIGRAPPHSEWFDLEDDEFVRHAFRVLLGREAEQEAVDGRVMQLRSGLSRPAILAAIHLSDEGKARPLRDPRLRRMLFTRKLLRSALPAFFLGKRTTDDTEPEDLNRHIRRIDSQQRSMAADVRKLDAVLTDIAQYVHAQGGFIEKFDALEAKIGVLRTEMVGPRLESLITSTAGHRLGPSHVALFAPGAIIEPSALSRLADATKASDCDIIFGNEYEHTEKPPFRRLRILGPFSHEAFLSNPDIGGVVAVHEDLLKQIQRSSTVVLTGQVILRLVALAHTIRYFPTTLCWRTSADIAENRPTMAEMASYLGGFGRRAVVAADVTTIFDIRFPQVARWKAAVVVICQCDDDELDRSLTNLRAKTPQHQFHLIVARTAEKIGDDVVSPSPPDAAQTVLNFPEEASYSRMVNEAVRRAPVDCNLIVVMDGGVSPTASDWLERLAESALLADTGVVAPKTVYQNGRIRHSGMALGLGDPCGYVARFQRSDGPDSKSQEIDLDRLNGLRDVSIVSHHCMMLRRTVFFEQGQFEENVSQEANDIDFCCRLKVAGLSVLVDGRVVMVQSDPMPRWARTVPPDDLAWLRERHDRLLVQGDRCWVPAESTPAIATTGLRTVYLPPWADR